MPFTYLFRMALLIQGSASVFFFMSDHFPWQVQGYVTTMLSLGLYLLCLIPPVLAMLLYIFPFPLMWKFMITCMTLAFFIVFLPCQYMLHAWIIHRTSLMFLPVLYFMFAILIDVQAFICFYSLGMGFRRRNRKPSDLGRYA